MNTVQRFFRRYIFFHNRNHDAVFAANRTPLSMVGEKMAAVCVRFRMTGRGSPGISESVESGG